MSVSADYCDTINLYCNETAIEVVSLEADIGEVVETHSSNILADDESYTDSIFDSELDQMLEPKLVKRLLELPDIVTARRDAVNWILKVHAYYQFRPETAYLSVNYLDRFLSFHSLPQGKGWPMQLLAVACLSVAAKLEETNVPLLLELQILEPRFLFKPSTIQRMELLVMAKLKWRLHIITPFYFLHYFIAKLSCASPDCNNFSSVFPRSSDLIINICRVINFLDYTPSAVAASAVLWVTNQTVDDPKLECLHEKVNRDKVKRCYNLVKKNMSKLSQWDYSCKMPCKEVFCAKEFKSRHSSSPNKC
ncbi:cyclin d, putative [Ricinus communis]|uniref:B-like cyclin n=1 Tax=Ricinus communis TaxID=3988 RepID=B9SH19_RICCO|nr:cyclin d, putative [Ricinus communis]